MAERLETNKAVNPLKVFDGLVISWSRRRRLRNRRQTGP